MWNSYELDLVNYQNKCRLIRGWDDLFNKVKEHINSVSAMKLSPYYKVLLWGQVVARLLKHSHYITRLFSTHTHTCHFPAEELRDSTGTVCVSDSLGIMASKKACRCHLLLSPPTRFSRKTP